MEPITAMGGSSGGEARSVDAGRGGAWWSEAWALFMRAPGMWVLLGLLVVIASIVISFVPVLGAVALSLLFPAVIGGLLLAARKLEQGGGLEVGDVFLGFKQKFEPLLVIGGLMLAATVVVVIIAIIFGIGAVLGIGVGAGAESTSALLAGFGSMLVMLLLILAISVLIAMALWFAPALVVFRDVPPVQAVKLSFSACLSNVLPMIVYGLIYIVAAIVASIPFALGWLVLVPLVLITMYTSYKDVFEG